MLSPTPLASHFAYAVCQIGAEPALKAEVAHAQQGWRFAFSRPGLVTWRTDAPIAPDLTLGAVFARAFGLSLGKADDDQAALGLAQALRDQAGAPPLLHVFERDRAFPGEEREDYGPLAAQVRGRLIAAAPHGLLVAEQRLPRQGELVLDVIAAPQEPLWLGCHVHGGAHSPHPGGRVPLVLPAQAPSRAWLKIEEALAWSRLPLRAGEVAVEIGSAPGGTSWALLERGLRVVGIDRGRMDPLVLAAPGFAHLRTTLGDVRREELPAQVDWLLMDVSLAPQVALHGVRRLVSALRPSLRGVIFTLKLNEWGLAAQVPALLARVAGMGLVQVRATQLPSNRREICVVGKCDRFAAGRGLPGGL